MARATTKSTAKETPAPESVEVPTAKGNRGRELLELRIRWKIVNETVEAGLIERKRLREAIDSLANQMNQDKGED